MSTVAGNVVSAPLAIGHLQRTGCTGLNDAPRYAGSTA